jgi:hypothetical protein
MRVSLRWLPHLLLDAVQHDAAAERVAGDEDRQVGAEA